MIPRTPNFKVNVYSNVDQSTLRSAAAAAADSPVPPPQIQVEGQNQDNSKIKLKIVLKPQKPPLKKTRRHWPKIILDSPFDCAPKPKTPKPKTPKKAKPKKDPSLGKEKCTKGTKNALIVVEDVVAVPNEKTSIEVVVPSTKPPILATYSRRKKAKALETVENDGKPPIIATYSRRQKEVAKRALDFDQDCQQGQVESFVEAKWKKDPLLRRVCRASMDLRCDCCVCRVERAKPAFPRECRRVRTSIRLSEARRKRLVPTEIRREDVNRLVRCTLACARIFRGFTTKKRTKRVNKFKGMRNLVFGGQQIALNDLGNSIKEDCTNIAKIGKKQTNKVAKQAKPDKEKTSKKNVSVSKAKKKKEKEEQQKWENATIEERVEILARKLEELRLEIDLDELHASTKIEVDFDDELMLWNLLKDKKDDEADPLEDKEEKKKKWQDKERKELLQKAGLFSMMMLQILGNRAFSPWKGSVVDSVVGVFLTQNVSDSLSSSAYMSLAARFPVKQSRQNVRLSIENGPTNSQVSLEILDNSIAHEHHANVDPITSPSNNPKTEKTGKSNTRDGTDWDVLRRIYSRRDQENPRNPDTMDSVDWDAVRKADVKEIAKTIEKRGQHNIIAQKIKDFLNRLVEEHGSIDLEWLRDVPPDKAKEYLLSIHGLGLKSVECLRLLTLHHHAFPVDVNVGRIAVRLGWVPLKPLPDSVKFHLLNNYPYMDKIQAYLWSRLSLLDQKTLYRLHYQMITFGKVFCTAKKPHCKACPLRGHCKYYASASSASRLALPGSIQKDSKKDSIKKVNLFVQAAPTPTPEPIIEEPPSPSPEPESFSLQERDIEDLFLEDSDDVHSIDLRNLGRFREDDVSGAIVVASSRAPLKEQKLSAKLRTEHQVYELPDIHPLLQGLPKREQDDPCYYLLATWPQDEMSQKNQTIPGTLLIPSRTAMEGRFPLNGTYFQVNEVFVDHETSICPINVPRELLWNLPKKTLYCGTSTGNMLRGLKMEQIVECFGSGYICIRGFNRRTRYPEDLPSKFHERAKSTPNPSEKKDNFANSDS